MKFKVGILSIYCYWFLVSIYSQDGIVDYNYQPLSSNFNFYINKIIKLNNGKHLVARQTCTRINPNGTVDSTFKSKLTNGTIHAILELDNGKIIIGGNFTYIYNYNMADTSKRFRNGIAMLNADGTINQTFEIPFTSSQEIVDCIVKQSNNKILLGGRFGQSNNYYGLKRLHSDFTQDFTLSPSNVNDANFTRVFDCLTDVNDKIIVSDGQRIKRLHPYGLVDPSFTAIYNINELRFSSLARQNDNKIVVTSNSANMSLNDTLVLTRVMRFFETGLRDSSFNVSLTTNSSVFISKILANGKILIGGSFTQVNGVSRKDIARLNTDGSLDLTFDASVATNNQGYINDIIVQNDENVVAVGSFNTMFNNFYRENIVRLFMKNGVWGVLFNDYNRNCITDSYENSVSNIQFTIQPGNLLVETNEQGLWHIDSLPVGNYQLILDTITNWKPSCDTIHSFEVLNLNDLTQTVPIGIYNTSPCTNSFSEIFINMCSSYLAPDNQTYSLSGSYLANILNSQGCDSIITINLTISQNSNSIENITTCGSFFWNGDTYLNSGTYFDTIENYQGCDSILTLNLTITQPSNSIETVSSCENYTWNGQTYTVSGTYFSNFTNSVGCDSIATLNLTILNPTNSTENVSNCIEYLWNGQTYSQSGTYTANLTNSVGCDSTAILELTILYPSGGTENVNTCENYLWNGNTYVVSGIYQALLTNAAGCDSTATLFLTILTPSSSLETISACESFSWNGNTYTSGGVFTENFTNTHGCDSIATLNLTINPNPTVSLPDLGLFCDTLETFTLTVGTPSGGQYSGTSVNANQFNPDIASGTYIITYSFTDVNGCTNSDSGAIEVIECINSVSLNELSSSYFTLFPNPTNKVLTVNFTSNLNNEKITVLSPNGQILMVKDLISETLEIDLSNFSGGMYFIKIGNQIEKFIKE